MGKMEIPAEAAKQLEYIEDKYDIFFRANNKQLSDYLDVDFNPDVTLRLKANTNLPFTLINDLMKYFRVEK